MAYPDLETLSGGSLFNRFPQFFCSFRSNSNKSFWGILNRALGLAARRDTAFPKKSLSLSTRSTHTYPAQDLLRSWCAGGSLASPV
jgi:hypothetical protein